MPSDQVADVWGCADLLRVMIWLVPAGKENIADNVPAYLNAETTVLQQLNDTAYFQASSICSTDRTVEGAQSPTCPSSTELILPAVSHACVAQEHPIVPM